jgi:hypothetical protein
MQNEIEPTESIEEILGEVRDALYAIGCRVPGIDTRECAFEAFRKIETVLEQLGKESSAC